MKRQTFLKSMLCLLIAMLCLPMAMQAKVEHLLPKVHSLVETKGTPFALKRAVSITDVNNTAALKKVFTDNGCTIEQGASATVTVEMVESIEGAYDYTLEGYDNEGYQLIVTENSIVIKAVKPIGVIRAAQTLAQLAEGYDEGAAAIEEVEITDWAAFKLRGYMHDVGRSFISVEELKKHIDLLSRFKVNTFHWHFTENQAWRFEVDGYPQLTSTESMTRFEGKYYTQAECREVAAYAHERGVAIIPEIDMPGHSAAFKRAMGFGMQTDEGVEILKKVLTQVADVFPNAPYIHIGADEETIEYPNFLGIMADHIHGLGRKMIVWNPISGVSINNTMCDMTQMWSSSGKNIDGVPDIDCRYNYTNHFDVFADVVGIYKSNIYYADKGSSEIAGTISAYWNDRKTPTEEDIVKQNNMYANVLASAERAWIGSKVNGAEGYIEKLGTTLPNSGEVYEEFKSWEERFLFHKANSLKDEPIPYVKQTNVRWRITDPFPNGGNSGATFAPDQYATSTNDEGLIPETFTHEGKTYYTGMATGAGIYLRHVWGNNIIPTYYGSTNHSNMTAYAWTYVYSPKAQTVGAQIEFQNYGRSEKDSAPDAGKWDRKGSDIWLNGSRINPPTWDNTGKGINNEVDLLNENFTARNPIEVQLNEGWNKVFIKLPYVGAGGVRLNKWMFTCVFTDLEGKNAVEGLIYSPNQCMDETTEAVAAEISNIKRDRSNYIGTAVGLWPESAAADLDAKVKEVEATYTSTMTEAERKAQAATLQTAWADFVASLANVEINQPVSGNYYRMYTPGRENRYPTGKGAGNAIIGEQNPTTKASIWQFVSRGDNSYDIVNYADGTYISPASNNNTALNAVAEKPTAGWVVKAAGLGKVIITSGNSVQLHQTNNGNGYKLFNWGANSNAGTFNTTDGGCVYQLIDVTSIAPSTPIKLLTSYEEFENGNIYTFVTKRGWMGATANSNNVISTARTTVEPAAAGDNPYFQWTVYKSDNKYYLYNLGKKQFMGVQSSNNASIPFAAQPAGKALTFKQSSSTDYPIMFSTDNAGVANHSPNHGDGLITWTGGWNTLNDEGSNHQVALISKLPEATLQEIAAIVADYEFDDVVIESAEEFENGGIYTFETARGKMGATEANTKVISTARTSVSNTNTNLFKWTVYKSNNGNYYLYNLGKQQFMGMQTANNTEIDFVKNPVGKTMTFKQSSSTEYPIMFSTDNNGVVNHSTAHGGGLVNWTGGWNKLDDGGSNHKVTLVSRLPEATLQEIAAIVENYDKSLPIKVEVEGWTANNPNTHFGNVTATTGSNVSSTKLLIAHMAGGNMAYSSIGDEVAFTRAYRGFEFQGYFLGEESLGKSFTLTAEHVAAITAENPLVAKFKATDAVTLFYDDDPFSYRIPAIATTSTGRLIAVSDYRYSLDDIGRYNFGTANPGIDLVIRMSDDNGKTWSATKTIAKGSCVRNTNDCAYGDAAIAVVGEKVLVMGAAGDVMFGNGSATAHNRTVRILSEDNGETWTKPLDISETFFINADATINSAYSLFFGSGKLAVDENYNGTGKARIYGAVLVRKNGIGNGIYVVYTDDFGLTWSILGGSQTHITANDEPKVEILPSGQILLSVRRGGGRQFNVFTYSDKAKNEGSWNSNVDGCSNGGSNTCNGEIFLVDAKNALGEDVKLLLQSQPKGGSGLYDRRDVTIWYKEVDNTNYTSSQIASDWTQGLQVSTQLSAYSTMSLQQDGKIAFFFEEAPCYGDDQAKGYCMVYMPLTIESITKGNYFSPNADLDEIQTINVVLTDAQGNEYRDQVQSGLTGVADAITAKYTFITLGNQAGFSFENGSYTYTNSVTLPFKVSNAETTVWHNIYWHGNNTNELVYLYGGAANDGFVAKKAPGSGIPYGDSNYNTAEKADNMSWAFYHAGNFTFTLKNKLTGKFIKVTSVATGNSQNTAFVEEGATAFEIVTEVAGQNYKGDYALKATVDGTVGYLCNTSASYGWATHYTGNGHQGGWATIAEAPDYEALIASITEPLASGMYGDGLGQYKPTGDTDLAAIRTAMENSNSVKLNTLNSYKALLDAATLNMPQSNQFFRVAYDYGNAGKLYMQSTASTVKGLQFAAETGAASIWVYYDGALYSYAAGQCLREHSNDRGLQAVGGKTTATFSASTRAKGKYNIVCGSYVHANSSNGSYYTDHCSGNSCAQHDLILEEVDALPITIAAIGYGTLFTPVALSIPEGVKAYAGTLNDAQDELTLTEVEAIPANRGVVLYRAEGSEETNHEFEITTGVAAVASDFVGSVATTAKSGNPFTLQTHDYDGDGTKEGVAFKMYTGTKPINGFKAYLNLTETSSAGAKAIRIHFAGGETSIDMEATDNGQQPTAIYDLLGRRVEKMEKGIYIVNGKKVIF